MYLPLPRILSDASDDACPQYIRALSFSAPACLPLLQTLLLLGKIRSLVKSSSIRPSLAELSLLFEFFELAHFFVPHP